jgi:hypothetical protein
VNCASPSSSIAWSKRYGKVAAVDDVTLQIERRVRDPAGTLRVRQDDDPDGDRRFRAADLGEILLDGQAITACRPSTATSAWSSRTMRCSRT